MDDRAKSLRTTSASTGAIALSLIGLFNIAGSFASGAIGQ